MFWSTKAEMALDETWISRFEISFTLSTTAWEAVANRFSAAPSAASAVASRPSCSLT